MLRVDLKRARPGMVLALPIINPQAPSRALLKAGYALEDAMIGKLNQMGIRSAWVKCPALDFMKKFMDRDGAEARSSVVAKIADTFELLQEQASANLPYDTYVSSIETLVGSLISNPSSAIFLGDLIDGPADLMRHSSTVTYLSLLLGLKLEAYMIRERRHVNPARAKEVVALGMGAMLHDVGLLMLDEDLREEFAKTGDDTDPRFKSHCALGYQTVRGNIDPSAATVVLHHHQRYDGKGFTSDGFPLLDNRRIHVFSRIVAVADAFDRLREPCSLPPQPTAFVLHHMVSQKLSVQFDPVVLMTLLDVVPPFAPGSIVTLSDGRFAVVIEHHPETPCLPSVQLIDDPDTFDPNTLEAGNLVNLANESGLFVAECDGYDVREYQFTRPDPISLAA